MTSASADLLKDLHAAATTTGNGGKGFSRMGKLQLHQRFGRRRTVAVKINKISGIDAKYGKS